MKPFQASIESSTNELHKNRQSMFKNHHKLSLTPATSYSNIPARWQSTNTTTAHQPKYSIRSPSLTRSVHIPQGSRLLQPQYALQKCRSDPNMSRSRIAKFKKGAEQFWTISMTFTGGMFFILIQKYDLKVFLFSVSISLIIFGLWPK